MPTITVDDSAITADDSSITADETIIGATMTSALNPIGIGSTPLDQTGDPARAGVAKIKSDHANFLAAIGRRQTNPGTFGITSSGGSASVLNDDTQNWAVNQFAGQTLYILTGTAPSSGIATSDLAYSGTILSNTATSITLSAALPFLIGSGIGYQVAPSIANVGSDGFATTAGGTGPSTLVDNNQAWTANAWSGYGVTLLAGIYAGQTVPIISNTTNTLTLAVALATAIAAGTPYAIGALPILPLFNASLSVALAAGNNNNLDPANWVPGGTNRLILTPNAGGSAVTGILGTGVPDGFPLLLCNPSASVGINFPHESGSSSAGNQFACQNGALQTLPPFGSAKVHMIQNFISGVNYWVFS